MKLLIFMLLFSTILFATKKIDNLIIFKVISQEESVNSNLEMLNSSIETNLTSLGYGIINETIQNEALREQQKQQNSDCYDDQCLVDTGRMLTAKKLLIIRVSKQNNNNFFIKLRKIDIETGIIENSSALSTSLDFENYETLNKIVKGLIKKAFQPKLKIKSKKFINFTSSEKDVEVFMAIDNNPYHKLGETPIKLQILRNQIKKIYFFKQGFLIKEYEFNHDTPENIEIELEEAPKFNLSLDTKLNYKISYTQVVRDKSTKFYELYSRKTLWNKYYPDKVKTLKLPKGRYIVKLRKKGYRTITKIVELNENKLIPIKEVRESIFIGTVEAITEYKAFFNIDNIKTRDFYSGAALSFLTILSEEVKFDFIRFGFLSDFKSDEKSLKNIRFSLLNMEIFVSKNVYISFLLGFLLSDGDIFINTEGDSYSLVSPIGFKLGYKYDIIEDKLRLKIYQKADWLLYLASPHPADHGLALTTGLSLEFLY